MSTPAPDLTPTSPIAFSSFGGYSTEPEGLEGVSFWPRAIARVIDLSIHYVVGFFAGRLFRLMLQIASGGHIPFRILIKVGHVGLPVFIAGLLGAAAYQVICVAVYGSTLGKLIFSMVVVQEDGSPCRFQSAVIRELGYFPDSIFFGIVGYMAMQRSRQQKRYGDEWADTVVTSRHNLKPESLQGAGRFVVGLMFGLMADAALLMTGLLVQMNG